MSNSKKKIALDISHPDIPTPKSIRKSKDLYFTCKDMQKLRIRGVQEIQLYYQHGKMHKLVNDGKFFWRFSKEDLT
jgi:hypothetical protein